MNSNDLNKAPVLDNLICKLLSMEQELTVLFIYVFLMCNCASQLFTWILNIYKSLKNGEFQYTLYLLVLEFKL